MPGMDELEARLASIENSYYGDKQAAIVDNFMGKYGSRFKNDRGLGLAILNELNARGVDTSAADEAVTDILDQLRTEVAQLSDLLSEVQEAAAEQLDKIDKVADVVGNQVVENPGASEDTVPEEAMDPMMPDTNPTIESMAPDGEFDPSAVSQESAPEEQLTEEPQESAPEEQLTEEPQESAPEEQPGTVSDRRLKRIVLKKKSPSGYKPSAGILSACGGI